MIIYLFDILVYIVGGSLERGEKSVIGMPD
jgi:hypothetical protein